MILMLPDDSEDEYVGICAFLNVVPLLYHCGAWQISHRMAEFPKIVKQVLVFAVCFLDRITLDDLVDYKPSLSEETIGARGY